MPLSAAQGKKNPLPSNLLSPFIGASCDAAISYPADRFQIPCPRIVRYTTFQVVALGFRRIVSGHHDRDFFPFNHLPRSFAARIARSLVSDSHSSVALAAPDPLKIPANTAPSVLNPSLEKSYHIPRNTAKTGCRFATPAEEERAELI
jgi:hypothetical protein